MGRPGGFAADFLQVRQAANPFINRFSPPSAHAIVRATYPEMPGAIARTGWCAPANQAAPDAIPAPSDAIVFHATA